ncbi:MAG: homocysteine S-methyltransferase [Xanthomonadales bacterium]|jgi:homocysteine S-methyltransferase|nr:homocysteine S-methyltransferase [Xanthomonadales bacterium]
MNLATELSGPDRFARRLRNPRPLLLDGGLATQLEAQGVELHPTLWSAGLLASAPEAIQAAHRAYLDAGAEVLITASYQASRAGFATLGMKAQEADALLRRSVELARTAGAESRREDILLAASVGPWGATQHDGSEYTGRYALDEAGLASFHAERLAVLDTAGADVLACETLPHAREIAVLAELLRDCHTPAWVSFCCRDEETLQDGTPLAEAAAALANHPRVLALGINCTAPRHVLGALGNLRAAVPELPVLVYPNSGERYDPETQRWSGLLTHPDAAAAARSWIEAGARGVGGCCRMGPAHIAAMRQSIRDMPRPTGPGPQEETGP